MRVIESRTRLVAMYILPSDRTDNILEIVLTIVISDYARCV